MIRIGNILGLFGNSVAVLGNPIPIPPPVPKPDASGGTITTNGDLKIHTFTTIGTFEMFESGDVSVLILGTGGAGGSAYNSGTPSGCGGGGAAGEINEFNIFLEAGTYDVSVYKTWPDEGYTCSFYNQSAAGGGNGNNGRVNYGGDGGDNGTYSGYKARKDNLSGGGGAGAGGNATGQGAGGGAGKNSVITGSSVEYGHGGNGGIYSFHGVRGSDGPDGLVIIAYKYK